MSGGRHYLPLTDAERQEMLAAIGADSVEQLYDELPPVIRLKDGLKLPPPLSEMEALAHLSELAVKNRHLREYPCYLGAGVYDHFIPSVVQYLTGRSEFSTAYTPYQAEISQGLLQSIFEYQTLICRLTGMEAANASLYDGATSLAEAAVASCGATRRRKVLVSRAVNPYYRQVLQSYLQAREFQLEELPLLKGETDYARLEMMLDDETAALLLQQPNFFGLLEEMEGVAEVAHRHGALLVLSVDPISLALCRTPAEYDADIVTGEGQALGNPPSFGGPLLGFFAARQKLLRRIPGRIVGETRDNQGRRGFVLTLQTREQHIRRERATSNICSNQALNALAAAVYLAALGPVGLREVAGLCLQKAAYAREKITALDGFEQAFPGVHFKEFAVRLPGTGERLNRHLLEHKIIGGLDLQPYYPELGPAMLFCVTETKSRAQIDALVRALEGWS
ncbi:MAG TPA: aminomethyl-transferring glycine dehydrogenase subunit GcvPA [Bacillota bacterium]|nr:aminomethyl-transferring glycine dehydrogenase subunit GcvPA [Bacillota bacterium]